MVTVFLIEIVVWVKVDLNKEYSMTMIQKSTR